MASFVTSLWLFGSEERFPPFYKSALLQEQVNCSLTMSLCFLLNSCQSECYTSLRQLWQDFIHYKFKIILTQFQLTLLQSKQYTANVLLLFCGAAYQHLWSFFCALLSIFITFSI